LIIIELSLEEFRRGPKEKVDIKSRENYQTLKKFEKSVALINPLLSEIEAKDNELMEWFMSFMG